MKLTVCDGSWWLVDFCGLLLLKRWGDGEIRKTACRPERHICRDEEIRVGHTCGNIDIRNGKEICTHDTETAKDKDHRKICVHGTT